MDVEKKLCEEYTDVFVLYCYESGKYSIRVIILFEVQCVMENERVSFIYVTDHN